MWRYDDCFADSTAQVLCCLLHSGGVQLPAETLWNLKHHHLEGENCFGRHRTFDACCSEAPQVLLYTYPKTASKFLIAWLEQQNASYWRYHQHVFAALEIQRMKPPCLVVTISRDPFSRNAANYFQDLIYDEGMLARVKLQLRSLQAGVHNHYMRTGRWTTEEQFLEATDAEVRQDFYEAQFATLGYQLDFFTQVGSTTGVDLLGIAAVHPHSEYVYINATTHGCKCDVLLLRFEKINRWEEALLRFQPAWGKMPLDRLENAGSQKWYAKRYEEFKKTLSYSLFELDHICETDTMRLPFYSEHRKLACAGRKMNFADTLAVMKRLGIEGYRY